MRVNVVYVDSYYGKKRLKKINEGLSDRGILLVNDVGINNSLHVIVLRGGSIKSIIKNLNNGYMREKEYDLSLRYLVGINEAVNENVLILVNKYMFKYIAIERKTSMVGFRYLNRNNACTDVIYTLAKIYDASDSDTLKLVQMTYADDRDEWGLDQEIIDQIMSECTEVEA